MATDRHHRARRAPQPVAGPDEAAVVLPAARAGGAAGAARPKVAEAAKVVKPAKPAKATVAPATKPAVKRAVKSATSTAAAKPPKPAATKPAKPAATKPAKPAATKPAKPAATKPTATKPATTKPTATKPATTKPTKPAATKPAKPAASAAPPPQVADAVRPRATRAPAEDVWTAAELADLRRELAAEGEQLRGEVADADAAWAERQRGGGRDGAGDDQSDAGTAMSEREQQMSLANNSRGLLQQVDRAMDRLDAGTYGRCESCGQPIAKARLQAFPRVTLCVTCKQREERR